MGKKDPRVDGYIQNAADFARPILSHLRKLVHTACPEVLESIKWTFPHFEHKGVLCSMASFKQHCVFGFWKGDLVLGKQPKAKEAMGHFGRITSLADLPKDDVMIGYIREAVRLNEAGVKRSLPSRAKRRPVVVPDYFAEALRKNKKALATFEGFSSSHKREYVDWLAEAKREVTRQKRLSTAIDWLAKGKVRHWKYVQASCRP